MSHHCDNDYNMLVQCTNLLFPKHSCHKNTQNKCLIIAIIQYPYNACSVYVEVNGVDCVTLNIKLTTPLSQEWTIKVAQIETGVSWEAPTGEIIRVGPDIRQCRIFHFA